MGRAAKSRHFSTLLLMALFISSLSFPAIAMAGGCLANDLPPAGQQSAQAKDGALQNANLAKPAPDPMADFGGNQLMGAFQQIFQSGNLFNVAQNLVSLINNPGGIGSIAGAMKLLSALNPSGGSKFMAAPSEAFPALSPGNSSACNKVTTPPVSDPRHQRSSS